MAKLWAAVLLSLMGMCAGQSRYCSYFGNRAPQAQPGLTNCTWYRESSCCLQEEINVLFPSVSPPTGANKVCRNYMNYLMCYVCSPAQSSFYTSERLTVCESFCNDFYDACKDASLVGRRIGDLYANGRAFCQDRRYIVGTQSETCFTLAKDKRTLSDRDSPAGRAGVSIPLIQLCTLVGLAFTSLLPGNRWSGAIALVLAVWLVGGSEGVFQKATFTQMASDMGSRLVSLGSSSLKRDTLQSLYDNVTIVQSEINTTMILQNIKNKLEAITMELATAASRISAGVDRVHFNPSSTAPVGTLGDLPGSVYQDADYANKNFRPEFMYNRYYQ